MEFGTGAVKITPAHDPNDFEIGLRHHLEQITVIGKDGRMNENAGKYQGQTILECRENIVEEFRSLGLLEDITDLSHSVGECYRCGTAIEPLISPQWFVRMKPLAEPAIAAVEKGDTRFVPARFTRTYTNWMENIRDWCISRQLWWGHRIPVWYCQDCGAEICVKEDPDCCPQCGSKHLEQDPDVLDTWFSSALWPFSTLGWPEKTQLLHDFYPTNVLVTGYDIIFFWVARMMFSGLEQMGEVPFKDVFIHGIVRDELGRKMSKSLGNGIDPLEIIDSYGADSLRFTLVTGNSPGNDMRFKQDRIEGARNFMNKIWNASRFCLMNLEDYDEGKYALNLTLVDKWILTRAARVSAEVNANLEKYELGEALRAIYDFIWDEFCDWYVELAKPRLYRGTAEERYTAQHVLAATLRTALELLHPFAPFITEELWQQLPHEGLSIMLAKYPDGQDEPLYEDDEKRFAIVMEIVRSIRNIRAEMKVPMGKKAAVLLAGEAEALAMVEDAQAYIIQLAHVSELQFAAADTRIPDRAAKSQVRGIDIYLPLEGLIDVDKEIARIEKEIAATENDLKRLSGKLSNAGFLAKAPAEVVEKEKAVTVSIRPNYPPCRSI